MNFSEVFNDKILPWLLDHGIKILAIIIIALAIQIIANFGVARVIRKLVKKQDGQSDLAERKREDTLIRVFLGLIRVVLWVVVVLMVLSEFSIDIGPLLAGAGLVGVAVGFGAQYLVRDLITGLFIIMENQYRVGDIIELNGVSGTVEDINLRITTLRDADGVVHTIPNGEIKVTSNKSQGMAKVNLDIGIAYDADIDAASKVMNEVGATMYKDTEWQGKLYTAPVFLRVNKLGDSSVELRITCEVAPGEQWSVAGELRKRIKIAFDKANIEIPFPQMVIHKK